MKITYSIFSVLKSICENQTSRIGINYIVELTQNYAYTYLRYLYKSLNNVLLVEDVTPDELAIDAIAPLFERDDFGCFIKIKTAFTNWQPPIETEEQANFFLNRLVAKSTEKYVSELLRDSDPFFSKLLDSVNYIIEKHNYKKKQFLGTTYIVEDEKQKKIGSLPDSNFIDELPAAFFSEPNKMICEIMNYIKEQTDKMAAIPLNAMVQKIRKLKVYEMNLSDFVETGNESEIDSIVDKSMNATLAKMKESYLIKGKINKDEASGIKEALQNIALDLKDGGINTGLHKYFLEQFSELTFEDYHNKYQNIFEYLFKVLKKEIANQFHYKK
jgi:hypothetical protein